MSDEDWIVFDPDIRGGEPVVRGTRVSPYTLAARMEHGETDEVLDADFPHIPREGREAVKRWVQGHPPQGSVIESVAATPARHLLACQHTSYTRTLTSEIPEVGLLRCHDCGARATFAGDHVDAWQRISEEQLAERRDLDERLQRRIAEMPPLDGPYLADDSTIMWQRIAYWAVVGTYSDTNHESAWSTPDRAAEAVAQAIKTMTELGSQRKPRDLYIGEDGLPRGLWWRIDRLVLDQSDECMEYASSDQPGETGLPACDGQKSSVEPYPPLPDSMRPQAGVPHVLAIQLVREAVERHEVELMDIIDRLGDSSAS